MPNAIPRSALYMPGVNQRAMDKAKDLPCDAVIFDLEDAVAPDRKVEARELVLAQYAAGGYGDRILAIRANGIDSPWGEADLAALGSARVERVVLPKVGDAEQLARCIALLRDSGAESLKVWAMIETPQGVANVEDICAVDGLEALVMGTTDLAHELRVPHRPDRLGMFYALSRCVNAGRMHGVTLLDGVYLDIKSEDGFRAICEHGRALGFDGKTLIHPAQVGVANEVFGVSAEEVARARRIIDAWESAEAEGKAVAVLDDKLVEAMHVDDARRIIQLADH